MTEDADMSDGSALAGRPAKDRTPGRSGPSKDRAIVWPGSPQAAPAGQPPDDETLEEIRRFLPDGPVGASLVEWLDRLVADRRRLRQEKLRHEHDHDTLFSIVREISERTLDADKLEQYLVRTLMGRFLVWKVAIFRRSEPTNCLEMVRERGLGPYKKRSEEGLVIRRDSAFAEALLSQPEVIHLSTASLQVRSHPEARRLREAGIETIVPLISRPEGLFLRRSEDDPGETGLGAGEETGPGLQGLVGLGPRLGDRPFKDGDIILLGEIGKIITVSYRNELLFRRSIIDDLTQVASRGRFDARLAAEISRCDRYENEGFALLMLDLDRFKGFNDEFGHPAGDVALKCVAEALRSSVRTSDLAARYGGDEFAVILVKVGSREYAAQVAERIRASIGDRPVMEKDGKKISITASVGVAYYPECAASTGDLIAAADEALYRAKALGRDRVCAAEPRRSDAASADGQAPARSSDSPAPGGTGEESVG
jgi:diguanylate cyclase (GGDEF)-like protein